MLQAKTTIYINNANALSWNHFHLLIILLFFKKYKKHNRIRCYRKIIHNIGGVIVMQSDLG